MKKHYLTAKHLLSLLGGTSSVVFHRTGERPKSDRYLGGNPTDKARDSRETPIRSVSRLLMFLLLLPGNALCGENPPMVHGKVVDGATGDGLPFANILVQSTGYRTSTNADGEFSVPLPESGSNLIISFVGYEGSTIPGAKADAELTISLAPVAVSMHEVDITAQKTFDYPINSLTIGNARIEEFAGISSDPMRALQPMPGVSCDNELSARFDVRGGTSDENTFYLDGAEVYDPYHLKEVAIASLGIFNSDLIKTVDFSAGGFGARYGDALSSITNITYSEGNRSHFEGMVSATPLDVSTTLQGPIDKSISYILGARAGYLGYIVKEVNIIPNVYAGYYDVQGDVTWHATSLSKVQVDFLYSKDDASQSPSDLYSSSAQLEIFKGKKTLVSQTTDQLQSFDGHYSNALFSVHFDNVITGNLETRTMVYYTGDFEHQVPIQTYNIDMRYSSFPQFWSSSNETRSQSYDLAMRSLSASQDLTYMPSSVAEVDAGVQARRMLFGYDPNIYLTDVIGTNTRIFPDTTVSLSSFAQQGFDDTTAVNAIGYDVDAYAQQKLRFTDNLSLNVGVRYDYFTLDMEGRFSPRLNVSYLMPLGVEVNAAWGVYYQLPNYDQLKMSVASPNNTRMQKAIHYLVGIKKEFSRRFTFQVQLYEKYYSDLVPAIKLPWGGLFYKSADKGGIGFAKGLDLYYRMNLGKFDLTMSYGYLVAEEKGISDPGFYPRVSDQRHTVSVAATWRPGNTWEIYLRAFYGSGYAYAPYTVAVDSASMIAKWVTGLQNSAHLPPYERVDVRLAKSLTLFKCPAQLYLDVTNVLDRRNVWSYSYTYDSFGHPTAQPMRLVGIVPAIGISWNFGS